jgi:hypothetical protein
MKNLIFSKAITGLVMIPVSFGLLACEKSNRTFSLLDAASSFNQSATYEPRKVDILWVVDNSGSMATSQQALTDNFSSFINKFQEKQSDFHMAVTGTDAWRAAYQAAGPGKDILLKMRRGPIVQNAGIWGYSPDSGVGNDLMTKLTLNLTNVFTINAKQGINGSGDERAFASMVDFLSSSLNTGFRRPDAILSVIILSDEDDFSVNTSSYVAGLYDDENDSHPAVLPVDNNPTSLYQLYQDSRLYSVASFKASLDNLAGSGNYNVNAIAVKDTACRYSLNHPASGGTFMGHRVGRRYMDIAAQTGGATYSLCDSFGTSLDLISDSLIKLTSVFKLGREPVVSSIKVIVNGIEVPNNPSTGWTYNSADWSISFASSAVPKEGDNIQIYFTPMVASN